MKGKFILIFLIIVTLSNIVIGASITGIIYDDSLNEVNRAVIEISPPLQRDITQTAQYYFEVPPGTYVVYAYSVSEGVKQSTTETITVVEGEQIYDVFLSENPEEGNLSLRLNQTNQFIYFYLGIAFTLLLGAIFLFIRFNRKKNPVKEELKKEIDVENITEKIETVEDTKDSNKNFKDKILKNLDNNKGEMTQKQLRKEIPYSEAKISLLISELEKEGKIKKVKKGRINTIVKI